MKDNTIKSLWWLVKLQFKNSWSFSAWAIFYSFYSGASSIASVYFGAKFLSQVTAVAFNKSGTTQVYMWLGLLFGVQIVSAILGALNSLFERRFQQRMELSMNELLIRKMYELSQEQFDNQAFNTKLSRARESLFSMWRLTSDMSQLASALVRFISAIGAITIVAPLIGVIIAATVMIVAGVRARQNKQIEAMYKSIEPYDRVAYRTRWMLIDPNTMPEIRLMNAFKHLLSSWSTNLTKSQNAIYNHDKRWAPLDVATDMIEPVVSVTATVYFLQRLISGAIGLDRFIFLRGLIDQANNAAGSIASSFQRIHDSTVKIQSFIEIYNQQPSMPNGAVQVKAPLTIELRHVSFSYPGSKRQILNDISFIIVPGSKLALVGENGAGKSTLIKLLLRQYAPTSGEILINGTPIQEIEQTSYYAAISNLSQNFLMVSHLTIRDNLLMGLARKTDDTTMHRAAEMVGASDFIAKLPHKYDQRLDPSFDDGTGLSGGQQQRLGVARALLREGDIMILDEPTSAIDAKAEYAIFNNIYKYHSGKTTLIVSHRFSTVRKADKIIVLDGGTITEYGSHEELLEYNGLYKEMFDTQAEGYK